ncbi:glycosyltransferase family 4 protein [Porcipelethomonas ammoniilytica]|uniref:glycosyltransferase family 4 protein n=1 Tax=Porcipelethomonas ammoniilytica TaxID=2981722 RepID=UPI0008216EF9|nr:glycosyltransferase family 4 protein [Porcipelethomonas ammoniilytica]MCU6719127.1 glycosyltransferase family 4 protein [Porcipelethomonas ammoniilytica]MEE0186652.1 glycosyltransferase family 4 protein [Oscillospiraceae bacterium]SCI69927.1 GDP-mannose-dependent alpha-mannosyltransferase [uncultured Ruminococcus sp.]
MKILITADCYTPTINGVVTSILNLETELRRLGHDVKILCPSENFHSSESENVYRIGSVGVGRIYSGARAALRISQSHLQKLIDWKPDIIHSQSEFSSFIMAKRIAAEVNCPIVHTYHTVYENYTHYFSPSITLGRKAVIVMTKRILRHTKAVIAPSQKIERLLKDYGIEQPIKVIPTGLRLKKFSDEISVNIINELKAKLGIPLKSRVLITVGRAAKEKNIDELIRYFKRLDIENTVFVIVGGGPYLDALKDLAYAENISDKMIFTGAVEPENIAAYYRLGDIFLSASQSETQGLTYIEALASGLPAVCRRDDCLNDVITNGKNGGQYTDFKEFSELIRTFLFNDELYKSMSENAVQTAQKYSAEKFAKDVETVYMEILEKRNHYEITNTFYNCENCS